MSWYDVQQENDIMVSTRVRIARNLKKYPFSCMMKEEDFVNVCNDIKNAVLNGNSAISGDFEYYEVEKMSSDDAASFTEQHMISPLLSKSKGGAVLINNDRSMSLMINEEDHIRMQVILPGLKLKEAWETASHVDDLLEENVEYAFDEKLGYITSCPTNLGTGMRASVMMHLPALTLTREISKLVASAANLGLAVRGIYGEGSEALGNLYQISNQITLGVSEQELISKVENIAKQIEGYELEARKRLITNNKTELENRVWRSFGILKYSREISSKEAKSLISDVILGKALSIIDEEVKMPLIELMVKTEPAHITSGENMSVQARDVKRAELIRNQF